MCAWCCLCQAAPGQQVFKERQSNLPLSTCDIGSFSCCISQVVINWLFQHSEHAMMLQAMPNPFCTKVTAIWKLVSTFLSTFQVPTCVKKKKWRVQDCLPLLTDTISKTVWIFLQVPWSFLQIHGMKEKWVWGEHSRKDKDWKAWNHE